MRFDYSHSFLLFNRVCTTLLLIFLRNYVNCIFALDVLLKILMFIYCHIDFSFRKSRSWRGQLLLVFFDNVIHIVFIQYYLSH